MRNLSAEGGATRGEPLVDVGIPTYGRPRYLAEAVASVFSQTLDAWTLTISEDGPAEGSVNEAIGQFRDDPRVACMSTGEKGGAAGNMSALIVRGQARYVGLLHDDDRWEPEFLARRVAFLEAHPECGFVFSADSEIDENGVLVGRAVPLLASGVYQPEEILPRLLQRNIVSPPTLLVRRSAYEAVGPAFDVRFPTIYDYEMVVRLAIRFPAGYLASNDDSAWRRHGYQSSNRNYQRAEEYRRFLEHVDRLLARERPSFRLGPWQRRARLSGWLRFMALNALEQGDRRSSLLQYRDALRTFPPSALDPRVAAGLLAVAFGGSGQRVLRATRSRTRRLRLYGRL